MTVGFIGSLLGQFRRRVIHGELNVFNKEER